MPACHVVKMFRINMKHRTITLQFIPGFILLILVDAVVCRTVSPPEVSDETQCLSALNDSFLHPSNGTTPCRSVCRPTKTSANHAVYCGRQCNRYNQCVVQRILSPCDQFDRPLVANGNATTCIAVCFDDINGERCQRTEERLEERTDTDVCAALRSCFLENGWPTVSRVNDVNQVDQVDQVSQTVDVVHGNTLNCSLAADDKVVHPRDGTKPCRYLCPPIKSSDKQRQFCNNNCKLYVPCIVEPIIDACVQHDVTPVGSNLTCGAICVNDITSKQCNNTSCSALVDCYQRQCQTLSTEPSSKVNGGVCTGQSSTEMEVSASTAWSRMLVPVATFTYSSTDSESGATTMTSLDGEHSESSSNAYLIILSVVAPLSAIAVIALCLLYRRKRCNNTNQQQQHDIQLDVRNVAEEDGNPTVTLLPSGDEAGGGDDDDDERLVENGDDSDRDIVNCARGSNYVADQASGDDDDDDDDSSSRPNPASSAALFPSAASSLLSITVLSVPPQPDINVTSICGWILILQHVVTSPPFNWELPWSSYKDGFGTEESNFWLGLERMHLLTHSARYRLRVEVQLTSSLAWYWSEYSSFTIGDEVTDKYRLNVDGYLGDGGDGLQYTALPRWNQNGMIFSTYDNDNDMWSNNCATLWSGGWWFNNCFYACLMCADQNTFWMGRNPNYLDPTKIVVASRMMIKEI